MTDTQVESYQRRDLASRLTDAELDFNVTAAQVTGGNTVRGTTPIRLGHTIGDPATATSAVGSFTKAAAFLNFSELTLADNEVIAVKILGSNKPDFNLAIPGIQIDRMVVHELFHEATPADTGVADNTRTGGTLWIPFMTEKLGIPYQTFNIEIIVPAGSGATITPVSAGITIF